MDLVFFNATVNRIFFKFSFLNCLLLNDSSLMNFLLQLSNQHTLLCLINLSRILPRILSFIDEGSKITSPKILPPQSMSHLVLETGTRLHGPGALSSFFRPRGRHGAASPSFQAKMNPNQGQVNRLPLSHLSRPRTSLASCVSIELSWERTVSPGLWPSRALAVAAHFEGSWATFQASRGPLSFLEHEAL